MDEHRPARCADEPLDRNTPSVRSQLIPALPAAHAVDVAAAIELRPAFAQAENRTIAQLERDISLFRIDAHLLDGLSGGGGDGKSQRVGRGDTKTFFRGDSSRLLKNERPIVRNGC